jgi:hypothetical protein
MPAHHQSPLALNPRSTRSTERATPPEVSLMGGDTPCRAARERTSRLSTQP